MVPMVFVEHERERFMEEMEIKGPKLEERILDLENRLQDDKHRKALNRDQIKEENREMTQKDCESAKLWDDVSRLRNGMESFRKVLASMEQQFETFKELKLVSHLQDTDETVYDSIISEQIRCRIRELDAEVDGNIRKCEGLLAGMALAIQVVSHTVATWETSRANKRRNGTTTRDEMPRQTYSLPVPRIRTALK